VTDSHIDRSPTIILVETQLAENLGATARAMGNFGLKNLRLVNPQVCRKDPKAIAMAVAAAPILEKAQIFSTLSDACKDLTHLFATTACERQMIKPYYTPRQFVHYMEKSSTLPHEVGILFGPERTGLCNEDLVLARGIISIPVSSDLPSLNLAQAVSIVAYEWFHRTHSCQNKEPMLHLGETIPCTVEKLENFLIFLEKKLDEAHFWRVPHKKEVMWRNMRNIFTRHTLTHQDIQTLYGVIDTLSTPRTPKG
jgi:tRNA/rRNA methyltransferase